VIANQYKREVLSFPSQSHFPENVWRRHVCVECLGLLLRIREPLFHISARRLFNHMNDIVRDFPQFLLINCMLLSYNRQPPLPIQCFPNNFKVLGSSSQSPQTKAGIEL
jgi:hypothetical protein